MPLPSSQETPATRLSGASQLPNSPLLIAGVAVDLSECPLLLRFALTEQWPTAGMQREVSEFLRAEGKLTRSTRALVDIRELESIATVVDGSGFPGHLQAYLVSTLEQHQLARQVRLAAGHGKSIGIFLDEKEALEWLWNADASW